MIIPAALPTPPSISLPLFPPLEMYTDAVYSIEKRFQQTRKYFNYMAAGMAEEQEFYLKQWQLSDVSGFESLPPAIHC